MAFRKGMSGNPKGRPAGAKDKKSEQLRKWLTDIVKTNRDTIAEDLAAVDPATRLNFLAKILPYLVPRLSAVEIDQADNNQYPVILVEMPAIDAYKNYNLSSSEQEVLQQIEEKIKRYETIKAFEGKDMEVPEELEEPHQETRNKLERKAAQDEEQRAHDQLIHQQRLQQRQHSRIIRQY